MLNWEEQVQLGLFESEANANKKIQPLLNIATPDDYQIVLFIEVWTWEFSDMRRQIYRLKVTKDGQDYEEEGRFCTRHGLEALLEMVTEFFNKYNTVRKG